jgi:hypothetical protein
MEKVLEKLEKENIYLKDELEKTRDVLHKKNEAMNALYERIEDLEFNQKSYDMILGYTDEMSLDEKCNINEKTKIGEDEFLSNLSEQEKEEYDNSMKKENRMVFLGLEISRLQFEISELFQAIKEDISEEEYVKYKSEKRNFLNSINVLHSIYKGDKSEIFEIFSNIIRKQRKLYEYDMELVSIN